MRKPARKQGRNLQRSYFALPNGQAFASVTAGGADRIFLLFPFPFLKLTQI